MRKNIERKIDREEYRIDTPAGFPNIGMAYCPGRQTGGRGALVRRNSMEDLMRIMRWRAVLAVALLERDELERIGGHDLPKAMPAFGIEWRHCPVMKGSPLRQNRVSQRDICLDAIHAAMDRLAEDKKVIIFCDDGLDRTATFVCRLLIEAGNSPEKAMKFIGQKREDSLSREQNEYLRARMWR